MIRAVINAFNEEQMLPGCLESIHDQVDEIVVVDGAYAHFPHDHFASSDATREIARCYGARWVVPPGRPWATEIEKRNAFFVGEIGDWYLQIDADERLLGELPELDPDVEQYALLMRREGFDSWIRRVYRHCEGIRYAEVHCALWRGEELMRREDAVRIPPSQAQLLHLSHLRGVERQRKKRQYRPWARAYEREARDRLGV